MKGYALTPPAVVDLMVEKLFRNGPPSPGSTVLDPGCGTGVFLDGVVRWCASREVPLPRLIGVDSDPARVAFSRDRFAGIDQIEIHEADFLLTATNPCDYIIGNPPYVAITGLSPVERTEYRKRYATAQGRFDLYLLFFERALSLLNPRGRLVYITPEKFLYVRTAAPLRSLLHGNTIEELHFLDEATFGNLVTYPLVSTVVKERPRAETLVRLRDDTARRVRLPSDSSSWLPAVLGAEHDADTLTLGDICLRISCGVATGADSVFVVRNSELDEGLKEFAYPTIAGRHLEPDRPPVESHSMLVPYDRNGKLLPEHRLGELGGYLAEPARRAQLLARTCVERKPWYAFHETPPLGDLLRPKLLCKDIGVAPYFVPDEQGRIVPRHSVYYIVPADPSRITELAAYLNAPPAQQWLRDHCQRAAKDYLRMQSHILKRLPVPETFAPAIQDDLFEAGPAHKLTA
ncbi:MAG: Eco57I restriction-modification methylase domain-containing protein [Gemmatimonadaceae bacterium]